jgi:hypothetical protein
MVYRHYPLVDVHPYAYSAALALEAAGELAGSGSCTTCCSRLERHSGVRR